MKYKTFIASIASAALIAAGSVSAAAEPIDIEAQIQSVVSQLEAAGETYFTVATSDGESLVVTLTSQSAQAQTLNRTTRKAHVRRVRAAVPVKVRVSNARFEPLANTIGGGAFVNSNGNLKCTGAFTVIKGGVRGILTAGHCLNGMPYYAHPTTGLAEDATYKLAHMGSGATSPGSRPRAPSWTTSSQARRSACTT